MSINGRIPHSVDWSSPAGLDRLRAAVAKIRVDLDIAKRAPSAQRQAIEKRALSDLAAVVLKIDEAIVRQEVNEGHRADMPTRIAKAGQMTLAARLRDLREDDVVAKRRPATRWL